MSQPGSKEQQRRPVSLYRWPSWVRGLGPIRTWELEPLAYACFAAVCSLWVAHQFFSSMRFQLFLAENRAGFISATQPWSAPLDDVFIHFDFARSTARGFPFQWSEGNGYSSGGTSLLYPFVLALGYRIGYQHEDLMLWAGMVATASVLYCLLQLRGLWSSLPKACSWLLPPALLATGVLNWTLWSGMEVAFFLALWAACSTLFVRLCRVPFGQPLWPAALALGTLCAVLVATRPEAALCVACFALLGLGTQVRKARPRALVLSLLLASVPAVMVLVGQAFANKHFTGEYSAAGALVKLELNDPYLSPEQAFDAWVFHFKYQVLRITNYHFSSWFIPVPGLEMVTTWIGKKFPGLDFFPASAFASGWTVWLLALLGLFDRRTRLVSLLLWTSMLSFMAVVALNGHVRWQNERYTMPAVAWLLLNGGLGLGVALCWLVEAIGLLRARSRRGLGKAFVGASAFAMSVVFWVGQADAYDGQRWFFGRASRNIFDQHIQVANAIRNSKRPPHRVMVGDAGAIPYVADVPALDLIGLGGYRDLPFARASRYGVAAGLELIERMPDAERPDLLAIYPSWWGDLPTWFGQELWSVGVRGNVICGGAQKVVYRPDWRAFQASGWPRQLMQRETVAFELDLADLASERDLGAAFENTPGYVTMKLLPVPGEPKHDLWDAGRILPQGTAVTFAAKPRRAFEPMRIILRVAPAQTVEGKLWLNGKEISSFRLDATDGWLEPSFELPGSAVDEHLHGRVEVTKGELVLYHLWGVQVR